MLLAMRRTAGMLILAGAILWGGLAGCTRPAVREKPLPDPLLTSKKPIEGKPHVTDTGPSRLEELPPPPPIPGVEQGKPVPVEETPLVQLLELRKGS